MWGLVGQSLRFFFGLLPIVSIVVSFLGLPFGILNIELVKPKKGTTMDTIGTISSWLRHCSEGRPMLLRPPKQAAKYPMRHRTGGGWGG